MTQAGAIVGTMQYLSPEQAEGHPVDRRADLYSVGIVLYELLTGQVPFDGEAPISIAIKQINEYPVPPGQLQPGIPPALESVVLRALEKDPAQRFQSADAFIAALETARTRADAAGRDGADAGEPWRGRAPFALVGVGAGGLRRWPRSPWARTSRSPATGRRAEPRGARGERGGRRRAQTRAGDRVRPARVRRRPARRGDLAGPARRASAPRRARRHGGHLLRQGRGARALGRGRVRGRRGRRASATPASRPRPRRRSRTRCRRAT